MVPAPLARLAASPPPFPPRGGRRRGCKAAATCRCCGAWRRCLSPRQPSSAQSNALYYPFIRDQCCAAAAAALLLRIVLSFICHSDLSDRIACSESPLTIMETHLGAGRVEGWVIVVGWRVIVVEWDQEVSTGPGAPPPHPPKPSPHELTRQK